MSEEKQNVEEITNEVQRLSTTDGNCILPIKSKGKIIARMVNERNDLKYKMNHPKRGMAIIFGHENFNKLMPRVETPVDIANLCEVLPKLGFTNPKVYKDLCHEQVMKKVTKYVQMDHTDHDCILIVILSHGESDWVNAWDKQYKLDNIWGAFTADKCPTLAGKPKLFFVETSPGKLRDIGNGVKPKGHVVTDSTSYSDYRIPIYADFLVACSTAPKYCSRGDSIQGSRFIKSLCTELSANGKSLDLLMLLTFVAQRVAVETQDGHKQITHTMFSLTRIVRF